MNGKNFTPKDWSIYWEDIRTNNSLEQWNGKVTKEAGNKGLHIFKLGKYLHNYTKSVESIDIRLHMWGVYDNYKKASQSKKDEQFKKLWRDYDNELIRPWTLVKKAADRVEPFIPFDVQNDISDLSL